jgi:hypothetical protein
MFVDGCLSVPFLHNFGDSILICNVYFGMMYLFGSPGWLFVFNIVEGACVDFSVFIFIKVLNPWLCL